MDLCSPEVIHASKAVLFELQYKIFNNMFTVMSARNRPEYFADKLYKSMKGAGTNDSQLIRIVVSRSEVCILCIMSPVNKLMH